MNIKRCQILQQGKNGAEGPILYWMSRDMRVGDNWALFHAAEEAKKQKRKMEVVFNLLPKFLDATWRQYSFMLDGLKTVERKLQQKNVPFHLLQGDAITNVSRFVSDHDA